MTGTPGIGRAALLGEQVQFEERDASLLEAIGEYGSINRAAEALGRSQARALRRIECLEAEFGELVHRQRGGKRGGGSELTDNARDVLDRYHRIAVAVTATAESQETVLQGVVTDISGELADVDTAIGPVCGVHTDLEPGDTVQVRIPSDALTIFAADEHPSPEVTSARNHAHATIAAISRGETVHTMHLGLDDIEFRASITQESLERLGVSEGDLVGLAWKATATRVAASAQ